MKKVIALLIFTVFCLVQPVYPQEALKQPTVNQMRASLIRMQGQIDLIEVTIKYLTDQRKIILSDGGVIQAEIKKVVDEAKKQEADAKSLVDSAKDSAAGAGKDK